MSATKNRNRLICLDSNISAWAYRDNSPPESQEEQSNYIRSRKLVKQLGKHGYIIMIPSIVISELLCIYTEEEQNRRFHEIEKLNLMITEFTKVTALVLSRILHQRYTIESKAYQKFTTKHHMKYDSLILASAIEHGAECLYTCDTDFKKYPITLIPILGLDESPASHGNVGLFEEE